MYTYYSNKELQEKMAKAMESKDWKEYRLLQEEADIRGI